MMLGVNLALHPYINKQSKTTEPASRIPALTGRFWLFVADDINLTTGLWPSRNGNNAPPFTLQAYNSPSLSHTESWANGKAVLNCTNGCFYGDKPAILPTDAGFTLSASMGGDVTSAYYALYHGPKILGNSDISGLAFRRGTETSTQQRIGNGTTNASRYTNYTGQCPNGGIYQWDRPIGTAIQIGQIAAYCNMIALAKTIDGLVNTSSNGARIVVGGMVGPTGLENITSAPNARIRHILLTTDGNPLSESDRHLWYQWATTN